MTPAEEMTAIVLGCIGSAIVVPLVAYGLYRLDKHVNDRARERKAAMRRHPSNTRLDLVEASQYNPRKNAS